MSVYSDADNVIKINKPSVVKSVFIEHNFDYCDSDDDCGFDVTVTLYSDAYDNYGYNKVKEMLNDYQRDIEKILRNRSTSDCRLRLDNFYVED